MVGIGFLEISFRVPCVMFVYVYDRYIIARACAAARTLDT